VEAVAGCGNDGSSDAIKLLDSQTVPALTSKRVSLKILLSDKFHRQKDLRMSIFKKRAFLAGLGIAVLAAALLLPRVFEAVQAQAETVRARDAVETVLATGRVLGEKIIPLSFIRAGRIAEELVNDGDDVKAGQILKRLSSEQEETAVAQKRTALASARLSLEKLSTVDLREAEQRLRQARASAAYAADYLKRQTELYAQKAIADLPYEQARRDKEIADANLASAENQYRAIQETSRRLAELQVAQAENDLRKAEIELRETVLRAPLDGRVIEHIAHKGEFVAGGQKIMTFIPAALRTYVEVQVDEADAGKLVLGQKAAVAAAAFPGRTFTAAVDRIGSVIDAQRGTFAVRLALETFETGLLPDASVSVQVVIGEAKAVLLLEQRLLVRREGQTFVFVPEGRRARLRPVVVRDLGNGLFACPSGLEDGETVLIPQGLEDGMKIRLSVAGN